MQDPRLRLLAVIALSAIAFASVRGAVLAFAWWVCTLEGPVHLWRSRWPLIVFLPLVAVSLVLLVTGGDWASYSLRIAVVLLIAIFAYQDRRLASSSGSARGSSGSEPDSTAGLQARSPSPASGPWRARSRRPPGLFLSREYPFGSVASFPSPQGCSTAPSGGRTTRPISSWPGGIPRAGRAVPGSRHRDAISSSQVQPLQLESPHFYQSENFLY